MALYQKMPTLRLVARAAVLGHRVHRLAVLLVVHLRHLNGLFLFGLVGGVVIDDLQVVKLADGRVHGIAHQVVQLL